MPNLHLFMLVSLGLTAGLALGCGEHDEGSVNFESEAARMVRARVCSQDWSRAVHKGAAADVVNVSTLWPVSPYQLLVPSSGTGVVQLYVDAPDHDWLVYTQADVQLASLDGPQLVYNGPVAECAELGLVEYGARHQAPTTWTLLLDGRASTRVVFYADPNKDPTPGG